MDVIWSIGHTDNGNFYLGVRKGPGKDECLMIILNEDQLTDLINGAQQVKYGNEACVIGFDDPANSNLK
jgi:hypothetical protein